MKKVLLALALAGVLAGCNTPETQAQNNAEDGLQNRAVTENQNRQTESEFQTVTAEENQGRLDQELVAAEANMQNQNLDDPQAAQKAFTGNLAEIQLADLALEKSQNQQVTELATMIKEDHQKANEKLQGMAQAINAQLEEKLEPHHEQLKEKLQGLEGEEFDREYVTSQVDMHQMVLKFYGQEAENSESQELRSYFEESMPAISKHLEQAREIKSELGGSSSSEQGSQNDTGMTHSTQSDDMSGQTDTTDTNSTDTGNTDTTTNL